MSALLEYVAFRVVAGFVQALPLSAARSVAQVLARFAFSVLRARRSLTIDNLRHAFPEMTESDLIDLAWRAHLNLVTVIVELMWTPRLDERRMRSQLRVRNPEVLLDAHRRGKGLVLMSGHFGNWEWLSICSAWSLRIPFTVIVHPMHNSRVDHLVEGWRVSHGNSVVPLGAGVREVIRTLRARGVVAMLADQSGPSGAIYAPLFGRLAATYEGPATFALRTGAPIVIGFAERSADGSYDVMLEEIPTGDLEGADEANIRALTMRHVSALERAIRRRPDHWLWQHKRWKHHPGPDARIALSDVPDDAMAPQQHVPHHAPERTER